MAVLYNIIIVNSFKSRREWFRNIKSVFFPISFLKKKKKKLWGREIESKKLKRRENESRVGKSALVLVYSIAVALRCSI